MTDGEFRAAFPALSIARLQPGAIGGLLAYASERGARASLLAALRELSLFPGGAALWTDPAVGLGWSALLRDGSPFLSGVVAYDPTANRWSLATAR